MSGRESPVEVMMLVTAPGEGGDKDNALATEAAVGWGVIFVSLGEVVSYGKVKLLFSSLR